MPIRNFEYDIHRKVLISDCDRNPVEVTEEEAAWLYAINNKYADSELNPNKIGKWMLFPPNRQINEHWMLVKKGIEAGELWHAKVSTRNQTHPNHVIIIYTKDYTDIDDVIEVLDYLEASGLKPPELDIKYKTDKQTRAGVYGKSAWLYSANSVRQRKH